jgi:hypothetical protein
MYEPAFTEPIPPEFKVKIGEIVQIIYWSYVDYEDTEYWKQEVKAIKFAKVVRIFEGRATAEFIDDKYSFWDKYCEIPADRRKWYDSSGSPIAVTVSTEI